MKSGFTLAEVLVTLAVIGVIAAMTIPTLLGTTNQAELKTAFKKSLSVLNQAISMSVALDSSDASTGTGTDAANLANFFRQRLNVIGNGPNSTTSFYTADGMLFTFSRPVAGNCGSVDTTDPAAAPCVVTVDVNGSKKPNAMSTGNASNNWAFRDQYQLIINAQSVVPAGNNTTSVAQAALSE